MPDPYLPLIEELNLLNPPLFIFGGFAEDALLHGRVTRPHSDVDVFVFRRELEDRLAQFRDLGFEKFDVYYEVYPGKPLVLNGASRGLHLELAILETDDAARHYFVVREQPSEVPMRLYLPRDTWDYPPSVLDGVEVRTVSPLALYQVRAGLQAVSAFGELRETDFPSQAALRSRFFARESEAALLPLIAPDVE